MSTTILKLVSGEEVIGKIVEWKTDSVVLTSIRSLVMQPTGPGQMGIAMIPWMATDADGEHEIEDKDIMGRNTEVPKQLEDGYLQQTSGIQIASANDAGIIT